MKKNIEIIDLEKAILLKGLRFFKSRKSIYKSLFKVDKDFNKHITYKFR